LKDATKGRRPFFPSAQKMGKPKLESPDADVGHCTQERHQSPLEREAAGIVEWMPENRWLWTDWLC
jgi:hypothetical protein